MVLINDKCLIEANSFTKTKDKFDRSETWKMAYFKNKSQNNIINNIMMKYLMKDSKIDSEEFDSSDIKTMIFFDE